MLGALAALATLGGSDPAKAAWSATEQVKSYLSQANVNASLLDDGTAQLGFTATTAPAPAGGPGMYVLSRAPGAVSWTPTFLGTGPPNASFAFGRDGSAVVAFEGAQEGGKDTVWGIYRKAGGSWGAVTKLAVVQRIDAGPVAVIDDKGDAAAIWIDRSTSGLIAPDRVMQSSTSTGTWPASPTQLAPIAAPDPQIPDGGGGFIFANCGPGVLGAAVLPDGTPIAAWDSPYGSFKSHSTNPTPSDQEYAVCGVQMAKASGPVLNVTPRPAIGWNETPADAIPDWTLKRMNVDPVTGEVALMAVGLDDALKTTCAASADYCRRTDTQLRVSLGGSGGVPHPGTLLGTNINGIATLRNGFVAVASQSGSSPLAAGIGASIPSLTPLTPDKPLFVSSEIALGPAGQAQLLTATSIPTGLWGYSAGAGQQFGNGVEITSEQIKTVSASIDCRGNALAGMATGSTAGFKVFVATNPSGASSGIGCTDPGGEEPEPENPGPKDPGSSDPGSGQGPPNVGAQDPPAATPVPNTLGNLGLITVLPDGKTVTLAVSCSVAAVAGCSGTVGIAPLGGARISAKPMKPKKPTSYGSAGFAGIAPGAKKTVKVKLNAEGKAALRKAGSLRVRITAAISDARKVPRAQSFTTKLKLPSKHG